MDIITLAGVLFVLFFAIAPVVLGFLNALGILPILVAIYNVAWEPFIAICAILAIYGIVTGYIDDKKKAKSQSKDVKKAGGTQQ